MHAVWTSNHKGNVAELAIATEAARLGLPVLKPITEHGRYDLVLDLGPRLVRVQCKWASHQSGGVLIRAAGSRMGRNGCVRSTYQPHEIDALAAYCEALDSCYLLPTEMVAGRRTIQLRVQPARNNQEASINFAADYELGAVAQLEERRHGMAEVEGSSPSSSTSGCLPSGALARRFPARGDLSPEGAVPMQEFHAKLGRYVRRAEAGEEFQVTRWGRPVARLTHLENSVPSA